MIDQRSVGSVAVPARQRTGGDPMIGATLLLDDLAELALSKVTAS